MTDGLETPRAERPEISTYSSWQTAQEGFPTPTPRRLDSESMASIANRLDESNSDPETGRSQLTVNGTQQNQRLSSTETVREFYENSWTPVTASTEKVSDGDKEHGGKSTDFEGEYGRGEEADIEAGKPQNHVDQGKEEEEEKDPNLIDWDGPDDPENPMNWSFTKKIVATASLAFTTLSITFASSVFSTATEATAMEFGVSNEVMILGTSLFVLGFALGPMVWGPMSELYGRRIPLFSGFFVFAIFQIPVAVAQNLETIMLCRYVGGLFGSSALAVIGGALADFWNPVDRGVAICFFAGATFLGPVFGPVIGDFVTQSYLGWRWTAWITLIMSALFGTISLIVYPESYGPRILQARARRVRFETKNWAIHAKADERSFSVKDIVQRYLARPLVMIFKEPILVLITIYMSLIYGILYLFFEAYPISFEQQRGWSMGVSSLPFLAIIGGVLLGSAIIIWMTRTRFARKLEEAGGKAIPEERLPAMVLGGILFPIGLFWFAWTSNPAILWVPQVLAGIPIGAGVLMIFMQGLNYLIDVYMMHANSAIAANTLLRSLAGAGFPLFATPMFNNLGVDWASSLLGFLAVACIPFPVIFYIHGERIRKLSKYSPTD